MGTTSPLGDFEQLVLLAVLRLRQQAYGVAIRREIEQRTERAVSRGAVYITLDRLEEKGYLSSVRADEPAPRSGQARRYYQVEPEGLQALEAAHAALRSMWKGLEPLLGKL
jgi:PadR family transcriptional regulator PadR